MKAFIDEHRDAYGVEPICKVLPIAPSTYRAHAARRADPGRRPARARSDAALMVEIQRVFEANFSVYGVRKVKRQLGRDGIVVARCTVARLMRVPHLESLIAPVLAGIAESRGLDPRLLATLDGEEIDVVRRGWRGGSIRRLSRLVEAVVIAREALTQRH